MAAEKHLIVIAGPTASGKTALGVRVAQQHQTEVLSADSRQFYREMQIGTARPAPEELQGVTHHFLGHLSVDQYYSAGQYETDAIAVLNRIYQTHDHAVMVGGTGMYINAVCRGLDDVPPADEAVRERLNQQVEAEGLAPMLNELQLRDPDYYNEVDRNNPRRIIRALEVIEVSGKPYSSFRTAQPKVRPFTVHKYAIDFPREELYERINLRVDMMMEAGLEMEARNLYSKRHLQALQTVGYTELFRYFDGACTLPEAVDAIKQNTRRYAKRQLTWFRRDPEMIWLKPGEDPVSAQLYN